MKTEIFLLAAGMALGLLLYKPQLLLGLGVWWVLDVRRFWPAIGGLAVTGVALAGLSWAVLPAETAEWVRRLPDIARYDRFEFYNLHNPRGFGDLLTGNRPAGTLIGLTGMLFALAWLFLTMLQVKAIQESKHLRGNAGVCELSTICVDSLEFVVSKLKDRGTHQAFGVVTNAQDFMHILRLYVERELDQRAASSTAAAAVAG